MNVTIYHNPRCSKSRQTLEILRDKGIEPEIIEYLNDSINVPEIFAALKLDSALSMVRVKDPAFIEAGLSKTSNNEELLAAISTHPKLLERPIVVTDKGARICRPPEIVEEII